MPLSLSAEELDLLLALAAPIDQRQRHQFYLRRPTRSRRRRSGPGPDQGRALRTESHALCSGAFEIRRTGRGYAPPPERLACRMIWSPTRTPTRKPRRPRPGARCTRPGERRT